MFSLNLLTSKPDFIIIGAQRGGTSSLFKMLSKQSGFIMPKQKELHYFDLHYEKKISWYLKNFPSLPRKILSQVSTGNKIFTGEASPYYLFHPLVPGRIKNKYPGIKLIVLLRNPVYRAYSQFWKNKQNGLEVKSFSDALEAEENRIHGEEEKMINDPNYHSQDHRLFSYKARGLYAKQIKHWFSFFPKENFLFLESEYYFQHPSDSIESIFEFLQVNRKPTVIDHGRVSNAYDPMPENIRVRLTKYFEPYNEELFQAIDQRFEWD